MIKENLKTLFHLFMFGCVFLSAGYMLQVIMNGWIIVPLSLFVAVIFHKTVFQGDNK